MYQQWLTFDEVQKLTACPFGADAVIKWLKANNVDIREEPVTKQYIKAYASIEKWNDLLNTVFYDWKDTHKV